MNQRTIFIIILVLLALVIGYQSWRKFSIKKTSDEGKTALKLEVEKKSNK